MTLTPLPLTMVALNSIAIARRANAGLADALIVGTEQR